MIPKGAKLMVKDSPNSRYIITLKSQKFYISYDDMYNTIASNSICSMHTATDAANQKYCIQIMLKSLIKYQQVEAQLFTNSEVKDYTYAIQILDFDEDDVSYYLLLPHFNTSLRRLIEDRQLKSEEMAIEALRTVCKSINELFKKGIVLKEIIDDWIFIKNSNDNTKKFPFNALIGELGKYDNFTKLANSGINMDELTCIDAPDELEEKMMVYCIGCIFYFMLSGNRVYDDIEEMKHTKKTRLPIYSSFGTPLHYFSIKILSKCLNSNFSKIAQMAELCALLRVDENNEYIILGEAVDINELNLVEEFANSKKESIESIKSDKTNSTKSSELNNHKVCKRVNTLNLQAKYQVANQNELLLKKANDPFILTNVITEQNRLSLPLIVYIPQICDSEDIFKNIAQFTKLFLHHKNDIKKAATDYNKSIIKKIEISFVLPKNNNQQIYIIGSLIYFMATEQTIISRTADTLELPMVLSCISTCLRISKLLEVCFTKYDSISAEQLLNYINIYSNPQANIKEDFKVVYKNGKLNTYIPFKPISII